ncbi:MAG: HupE/UreJ family protein [Rhodobacteraceae bacterium]|nr:HupE/UreJ family protein [Alphaproteobacteria bacterium]NNK67638.1 HupE/UreJ family protein [Paracoccaceae bacterium]
MSRLVVLFVMLWAPIGSWAHEIQPAVADLIIEGDEVTIDIEMALEAPLAGIDLDGLTDTNDAENTDDYDALRALEPNALAQRLQDVWPDLSQKITLRAGDTALTPELSTVEVPPIGDVELARSSRVTVTAALPQDGSALTFGWTADLGALVVRQQGVEDGYTAYLSGGELSVPIPRGGGGAQSWLQSFVQYVGIGFEHIVPKGLDHILFVLGLFFLSVKLGPLLWQVSAFTLAHTVTLALGILGIVTIPASIVEPLIAASIVYVGVENVLARGLTPWRPVVVFCFGLLHGLGFASVLGDIGLDPARFVTGLIGFNIGVELGQLAVIAVAFLAVGLWFRKKPWYRARIATPASVAIALVGAWWVVERTLL